MKWKGPEHDSETTWPEYDSKNRFPSHFADFRVKGLIVCPGPTHWNRVFGLITGPPAGPAKQPRLGKDRRPHERLIIFINNWSS